MPKERDVSKCFNSYDLFFFLQCSLFPPFISSLTIFLGINLSVRRELVLPDISACVAHFFRLPFHLEKDSYSLSLINGTSANSKFQWHILINPGCTYNAKFLSAKNSWVPTENNFTKRTLFLWASQPRGPGSWLNLWTIPLCVMNNLIKNSLNV